MGKGKYLLVLLLVFYLNCAFAQVQTYEQADSSSYALFSGAEWKKLTVLGKQAVAAGIDFPELRSRVGFAYFITGNYKAALKTYGEALKHDYYNQNARYYAYLCHLYLNNDPGASYHAARLDADHMMGLHTQRFDIISAGLETSVKYPEDYYRGTASYTRGSLQTRLSWRLLADFSASYFAQTINNTPEGFTSRTENKLDKQTEYYGRLRYALSGSFTALGAYHYLRTSYQNKNYNSNIGLAGVKYTSTYVDAQADVNWGNMISGHLIQYNGAITYYPLGNLNLYGVSRGSYHRHDNLGRMIYDQRVGFKVIKNGWLETSATFGNLDNYTDAEALYIYNAIDVSKFKLGETAFYQLGKHAQLQLNYSYEKKQDETHRLTYNQFALTTGILWRF